MRGIPDVAGSGVIHQHKATSSFPPRRDFSSLSILDLLQAREAHHVQLSSLDNVIATAIGRYLIHEDDWYASHSPDVPRPDNVLKPYPRTLDNSVVRAWSWPCVLVFVKEWAAKELLGANAIPRALFMPDGRVIPTCVVLATPDENPPPPAPGPAQVSHLVGGGYSCLRRDQGIDRLGSIGCLVYKEGTFYALTSRHVAGAAGKSVSVNIGGEYTRIGESVDIGITKLATARAFPSFNGLHGMLNFDAGLIRIDNFNQWTSQVFGIGEIGEPYIATSHSLTLDVIGTPVRAFGGTSGVMEGQIRALFFQPRSTGSVESATDVLIGRRRPKDGDGRLNPAPFTRPGDSGTLWFYDPPSKSPTPHSDLLDQQIAPERGAKARRLQPVAIQWGGQRFASPHGNSSAFALGSFLSTVLRELDAEIEHNWSTGHDEYWGKLGHFAIGWKACDLLKGKLSTLMVANQERIGFDNDTLGQGKAFKMGKGGFVPLADVPDYVWVRSRENEPIQHFADVDIHDIDGKSSMLDRCHKNPRNCSAKAWLEYFEGFSSQNVGPEEGALPFRVWQLWDAMVEFISQGDVIRFVASAGVLAHYIGDASQPLHCSWLHHGLPPLLTYKKRKYPVPRSSNEFKAFKETPEYAIHGLYEEGMFEIDAPGMLAAVDNELTSAAADPAGVSSGYEAAVATLEMMYATHNRLSPEEIINADDPTLGPKKRATALWSNNEIRHHTIESLADSVKLLATLWASARKVGKGDAIKSNQLVKFDEQDLQNIYRRDDFVPSLSLKEMADAGDFEPPTKS